MIEELDDAKSALLDSCIEWQKLFDKKDFMPEISEEDAKKELKARKKVLADTKWLRRMNKKYAGY